VATTDVAVDMVGDVAIIDWLLVGKLYGDTCHLVGRMLGHHVAQSRTATWHPFIGCWCLCGLLKVYGGRGVRPPDLYPPSKVLTKANPPTCHALAFIKHMSLYVFKVEMGCKRWGVGPGLSPDPGFMSLHTTLFNGTRMEGSPHIYLRLIDHICFGLNHLSSV
jgi:hypothetical protein